MSQQSMGLMGGDGEVGNESRWCFALLATLLLVAPLVRGANRPIPAMVLELLALLLAVLALALPVGLDRLSRAKMVGLLGLCVLPLIQLLPSPITGEGEVYARVAFAQAMAASGLDGGSAATSLASLFTEASWLALLPPVVMFVVVLGVRESSINRLVTVFLTMAVFQAVLGLMQYGGGPDSPLRFDYFTYSDSAIGTYANRSHLAGLLDMALPISLGLLAASIFRLDKVTARHRRDGGVLARLKALTGSTSHVNRTFLYAAVCTAILLGVVFARSRTGIAVGMLGLLLTSLLLVRNFGGGFAARMVAGVSGLAVVLAVVVGLAPVFARFGLDATQDLRWPMLEATIAAGFDFLPFGSGFGTFVDVFRAYHPDAVVGDAYVNHAHNEYAEWWLEGGVPAMLLVLAFAVLYALRWREVWRVRSWEPFHITQVGAGVSVFCLAVFGLTDYNLRIPANALYFAFVAAVFFHPGDEKPVRRRVREVSPEGVAADLRGRQAAVAGAASSALVWGAEGKPDAVADEAPASPVASPAGAGKGGAQNPFGE